MRVKDRSLCRAGPKACRVVTAILQLQEFWQVYALVRAFNVRWAFAVLTWGLLVAGAQAQSGTVTNVALDRAAYQSSAINYDNVAHLATDGSLDSFWQSKPEAQPWIYVDLGRSQKVTGVKLAWGTLAPAACTVQVSNESSVFRGKPMLLSSGPWGRSAEADAGGASRIEGRRGEERQGPHLR